MVIGSAYIHLYQFFSKGIFHRTTKEIGVESIALYDHQWEIVQTKARSIFVLMFT
jgi:hypothetical protein